MSDILKTLEEEGFSAPRPVEGRTSIRHLWASTTGGLYVLHFADGSFYAGRSIHVVRRFAEHRRDKPDITHISFRQTARAHQDGEESAVITRLESAGFRLRNIDKVVQIEGPSSFDEIMEPSLQERWLNDVEFVDSSGTRPQDPALRARYGQRFHQLLQVPEIGGAIEVARLYVQSCIPAFIGTEKKFWQVTVLPTSTSDLLMRVNISWQVAFDIWLDRGNFVFRWYLQRTRLENLLGAYLRNLERANRYYWLQLNEAEGIYYDWQPSGLVKAGPDQALFEVFRPDDALRLLRDEIAVSVFREFTLDLIRQRKSPYGRYHCFDLADRLVED